MNTPESSTEDIFASLESVVAKDPFEEFHALAREFEQMLNELDPFDPDTTDLANAAVAELDSKWPHMDKIIDIEGA